jgi:hypothetical protein
MPILGVDELKQAFSDLSARLKKSVIRGGLTKAIAVVAAEIVPHTPTKLGLLKSSAETKVRVSSNGLTGSATLGYGSQSRIAILVEYGHADVGHLPDKKQLGVVNPEPWILPGLDRSINPAMAVFDEAVEESVINFERAK